MTVTAIRYPVAPATTPLVGTLLDAANVQDGMSWHDGNDMFDSYNCMSFGEYAEFCGVNSKDFTQTAGWQSGFRFSAYGGVTCRAVGLDREAMQSEVRRVFEQGESTAVERALMDVRFRADTENPARWAAAPVDITPAAGAVKPEVGLALLEGYASSEYVGAPTIHMPRVIASLLMNDSLRAEGDRLYSKMGSKVAAGAGYDYTNYGPTGAAAAVGEKWVYATGEVLVLRGDIIIQQAIDMENNDVLVLAERPYVAVVDCFTAAVKVTVTA